MATSRWRRALATLALIVIAVLIVMLLFTALTGGPTDVILALLFCLIVIPTVIYVMIWITGVIKK